MSDNKSVPQEVIDQARQQGATHYSQFARAFYKGLPGNIKKAEVIDGELGPWLSTGDYYLPEHAGRI